MKLEVVAVVPPEAGTLQPYVPALAAGGATAYVTTAGDGSTAAVLVPAAGAARRVVLQPPDAFVSHPVLQGAEGYAYARFSGAVRLVRFGGADRAIVAVPGTEGAGPYGPTAAGGAVAFRATRGGRPTVGVVRDGAVAWTAAPWEAIEGLPALHAHGALVVRGREGDREGLAVVDEHGVRLVAAVGGPLAGLGRFPAWWGETPVLAGTSADGAAALLAFGPGAAPRVLVGPGFADVWGGFGAGARLVVYATPPGGALGVFVTTGGPPAPALAIGDPLLGSTVAELGLNPASGAPDGAFAVNVVLADGRGVVLRAPPLA